MILFLALQLFAEKIIHSKFLPKNFSKNFIHSDPVYKYTDPTVYF